MAIEVWIVRLVDDAHPAPPELAHDREVRDRGRRKHALLNRASRLNGASGLDGELLRHGGAVYRVERGSQAISSAGTHVFRVG